MRALRSQSVGTLPPWLLLQKDLNITDLEACTMALEEAINAKFEAFENRMEKRIRLLFVELSMGRPPSPKKS
ncbi:hypothetical protein GW17_00026494 [Ensete ventricosum]|nr:hypothetical protein GW17_00026494 [Ensete ventricosum]